MFKDTTNIILAGIILLLSLALLICGIKLNSQNEKIIKYEKDTLTKTIETNQKVQETKTKVETQVAEKIAEVSQTVIEGEQREKVRIEYVTKQVDKVIFTPTYSNVCIDSTGLRSINILINEDDSYAKYSGATSEPEPAL